MDNSKSLIRKKMIKSRQNLNFEDVVTFSKTIIEKVTNLPQFIQSEFIMTYINFGNEVITTDFINICLAMGKIVAVPSIIKLNDNKKEIVASKISNMDCLVKGEYGILEPDSRNLQVIIPTDLEFIVVPGVAFDTDRNRIGFGKGYYDRFLKYTSPKCYKVGLAFENQICSFIPADKHDYPLNAVVTERRII